MKYKHTLLSSLFLLSSSISTFAWSQCAPGIPGAGNPACIPPDAPGSPSGQGNSGRPSTAPRWRANWGAITIDHDTGAAGLVTNQNSKSEAIQKAKKICLDKGGTSCELRLAYDNECAAVAWGHKGDSVASAETPEKASSLALLECGQVTTKCEIVYSGCSLPERIE